MPTYRQLSESGWKLLTAGAFAKRQQILPVLTMTEDAKEIGK